MEFYNTFCHLWVLVRLSSIRDMKNLAHSCTTLVAKAKCFLDFICILIFSSSPLFKDVS